MSNYRDVYYESTDGLRLYARDYSAREPVAAERETLLCLHGLTRNSADFAGLADHLSERFRVLAVDNRGRGLSDYDPQPANYTPAVYVQDMFTLLDELQLERVILCGTSMGGLMSFMMAAMQPERVSSLIINDIGPEVDPAGLARIKGYVGSTAPVRTWSDALAQVKAINASAFPDFSEQQWETFARGVYSQDNGELRLAYDPAIAEPMAEGESNAVPPDLWPLFDVAAQKPMLVVRGEHSDILSMDCVDEMRRRCPELVFQSVRNRGHAPMLTEPEALAAIDAFLGS